MLLRSQGRYVQHMQKALTQMNVQLANVISDVVGERLPEDTSCHRGR